MNDDEYAPTIVGVLIVLLLSVVFWIAANG